MKRRLARVFQVLKVKQIDLTKRQKINIHLLIPGAWNTSRGNRVTLSKYCYDTNGSRCGTKGYAYCVIKKKYVHPYSVPPSSVRKVVWLIKEADGTYNRQVKVILQLIFNFCYYLDIYLLIYFICLLHLF